MSEWRNRLGIDYETELLGYHGHSIVEIDAFYFGKNIAAGIIRLVLLLIEYVLCFVNGAARRIAGWMGKPKKKLDKIWRDMCLKIVNFFAQMEPGHTNLLNLKDMVLMWLVTIMFTLRKLRKERKNLKTGQFYVTKLIQTQPKDL